MDDLSGLNWSVQASSSESTVQPSNRTAFDYLAKTKAPSPRPSTPLVQTSRPHTPLLNGIELRPKAAPSMDAFSSLFDDRPSTASSLQSLSMAERLASTGRSQPNSLMVNGSVHSKSLSANSTPKATSDPWNFDLLAPASAPLVPSKSSITSSPLSTSPPKTIAPRQISVSPAADSRAFDSLLDDSLDESPFTQHLSQPNRNESTTSNDTETDDFDIFNRPAQPQQISLPVNRPSHSTESSRPSSTPSSRPQSPPPHILGQLVEMGFGIQEARIALTATANGPQWDVQAAAESIMNAQEHESHPPVNRHPEHAYQLEPSQQRRTINSESGPHSSTPTLQDSGQELLNQASEIGMSVLKSANSYWKSGRKAVQKVVEDRIQATGTTSETDVNSKRPKWMQDALKTEEDYGKSESSQHARAEQFQYSDDEATPMPSASTRRTPLPSKISNATLQTTTQARSSISDPEPKAYRSPFRHQVPERSVRFSPKLASTPPVVRPAPPPRPEISATPAQAAAAETHRLKGNEMFKLGRFSEAEASYSAALTALPKGHVDQIVLLTNRATARLKIGSSKEAVEDCTQSISLGAQNDTLGKTLGKRANGYEASERWKLALDDWYTIQRGGQNLIKGAGGIQLVSEGISRCERILKPPEPKPASLHRPKFKASVSLSLKPSEAVATLRSSNAIAEAEENQRMSLKDEIDSRLQSWRAGKESNLRALIASLDSVLWPELAWKKVGLHELVTESQLKIRYVKAVAKVHPDKLSSSTTTEQRMIANGVFSALSEAWSNHKPS